MTQHRGSRQVMGLHAFPEEVSEYMTTAKKTMAKDTILRTRS